MAFQTGEESNSFIVRPADELIMERFLSSLQRVTAAPSTTDPDESFVTARSGHNLCTVEVTIFNIPITVP